MIIKKKFIAHREMQFVSAGEASTENPEGLEIVTIEPGDAIIIESSGEEAAPVVASDDNDADDKAEEANSSNLMLRRRVAQLEKRLSSMTANKPAAPKKVVRKDFRASATGMKGSVLNR